MAGDSTTAFKCPESNDRHQVDHLGKQNPGPNQMDCETNTEMTAWHQPRGMKAAQLATSLLLVTDVPGSCGRSTDQILVLISDTAAQEPQ